MKTTIKRWLLAGVFTGALAERTIANHATEWRHVIHYAPDFLAGCVDGLALVAAFVAVIVALCALALGMQWVNDKLLAGRMSND